MPSALFSINADATDQGFDGTDGQTLTFALRSIIGVRRWQVQVFAAAGFDTGNAILDNPPRQSTGATELVLDNGAGGTGQIVDAETPSSQVTLDLPSGEVSAWMVRVVVNSGVSLSGVFSPELVAERIIIIPDGDDNTRAVVPTERTQYHDDGWTEAFNRVRLSGGGGGGGIVNQLEAPVYSEDFLTGGTISGAGDHPGTVGTIGWGAFLEGTSQIRMNTNLTGAHNVRLSGFANVTCGISDASNLYFGAGSAAFSSSGGLRLDQIKALESLTILNIPAATTSVFVWGIFEDASVRYDNQSAAVMLRARPATASNLQVKIRDIGVEQEGVDLPTATFLETYNQPQTAIRIEQHADPVTGRGNNIWDFYVGDFSTPLAANVAGPASWNTRLDESRVVGIGGRANISSMGCLVDYASVEMFPQTLAQRIG